jgi:hypothetical protein
LAWIASANVPNVIYHLGRIPVNIMRKQNSRKVCRRRFAERTREVCGTFYPIWFDKYRKRKIIYRDAKK